MASITEISPNVHRISILYPEINLQFNHLLVVDDEPLLYHTGMRRMFPEVLDAVKRVIDPAARSQFTLNPLAHRHSWFRSSV